MTWKPPGGRGSTNLLEKSLLEPPISCDGEPAPDRVLPAILAAFRPPDIPKGDLRLALAGGSTGEVLAAGDVERACEADGAE